MLGELRRPRALVDVVVQDSIPVGPVRGESAVRIAQIKLVNQRRLAGGLSGVGWVVAGGFEKERLGETGPLFFCYQGSSGYW